MSPSEVFSDLTRREEFFALAARVFGVARGEIDETTAYESIPGWDSVNHLQFPGREFKADTRHTQLHSPYPVPYRCLYSRNVANLFMAGRDISVTHVALDTTRVMRTCGMAGEVVGMAAAICHQYHCSPRGVYWYHLPELKSQMMKGTGRDDLPFNQGYNAWNPWSRHN